jgi:hypothetical protein
VSWVFAALLVCAVVILVGAEWPRLSGRLGVQARHRRARDRQKAKFRVVRSETEEFADSVRRDLDRLPTIEEQEPRR